MVIFANSDRERERERNGEESEEGERGREREREREERKPRRWKEGSSRANKDIELNNHSKWVKL